MQKLNILIIGGTGFIGRTLSKTLHDNGHIISVLSRNPAPQSLLRDGITSIQANVFEPGSWQEKILDFEVIINLTGASIFRRWTNHGKQYILDSRLVTTNNIIDSLRICRGNVRHFLSVSGIGYYGFHGDEIIDEHYATGSDFISSVAARWEDATQPVKEMGIRLVICRLGHVLGRQGGVLPKLLSLTRFHLSSHWGSGNQWISWVHEVDLTRAFLFLLNNDAIKGPVNVTSPNPIRNREMMHLLSKMSARHVLIPPIPRFMLQLMLGQFSTVFINGQRVVPGIIRQYGFTFKFPNLDQALIDLLKHQ